MHEQSMNHISALPSNLPPTKKTHTQKKTSNTSVHTCNIISSVNPPQYILSSCEIKSVSGLGMKLQYNNEQCSYLQRELQQKASSDLSTSRGITLLLTESLSELPAGEGWGRKGEWLHNNVALFIELDSPSTRSWEGKSHCYTRTGRRDSKCSWVSREKRNNQ